MGVEKSEMKRFIPIKSGISDEHHHHPENGLVKKKVKNSYY
jgi:hypothetical protein